MDNLKTFVKTVPFIEKAYGVVKKDADEALNTPIAKYVFPDGRRLSRVPCRYILSLLLTYIISGDKKYKDRVWQEIESICKFPDWNHRHDIDVGDYAQPIAFAYDWLYNEWTEREKRIMRNALLKNGIESMIIQYRRKLGIAVGLGNHNTVVSSGLGIAALAIGDEDGCEDIANEVINGVVEAIPYNLVTFSPYGVCKEGPHYWRYGQDQFYKFQASICSALKTDFGLGEISGMDITGDYIIAMNGPVGMSFNSSDSPESADAVWSPSLLWLARLYNKPYYAKHYMDGVGEGEGIYDLLYFRDGMQNIGNTDEDKDMFFGNVGVLRSDLQSDKALYVGFKGGCEGGHMDLDFGTFVFDAYGERWFCDLSYEAYDMPGMWCHAVDSKRWSYYRKRTEGNNTIVLNPVYNPSCLAEQYPFAECNIIHSESKDDYACATVDLTSAYPNDAEKVLRSFALTENRTVFEICDELELKKPSTFYAFMHTKAKCVIADDKKSAVLTINDKSIRVTLISNSDVELRLMEAEPMFDEIKAIPHSDNSEYRKIAVYGENIQKAKIKVKIAEVDL